MIGAIALIKVINAINVAVQGDESVAR